MLNKKKEKEKFICKGRKMKEKQERGFLRDPLQLTSPDDTVPISEIIR
jgi:hypothetical protein